jgi:ribosomal 50S subunit-associated protein YjgA (DUF615 family)
MTTQSSDTLRIDFDTWKTQLKAHKQQCGVAEMDTPGTTKDSREALHDTSNATDSVKDWRSFWRDVLEDSSQWIGTEEALTDAINQQQTMAKQKAVDNFLDTICCALEEMSGEEIFDCFLEAVQSQHEYTKKEYDKTMELRDMLIGVQ